MQKNKNDKIEELEKPLTPEMKSALRLYKEGGEENGA